jgi:hypothetical protein
VRRRRRPSVAAPEGVCRFVRTEWPAGLSEVDARSEWLAARFGWSLRYPDDSLPADAWEEALARRFRGVAS